MKSIIRLAIGTLFIATLFSAPSIFSAPQPSPFTVSMPDSWKPYVTRTDFENQSIFNFQTENKKPAFLFSITRVSDAQWLMLKDQLHDANVISNTDGFIVFVERTDVNHIKGSDNAAYTQVLAQLNDVIASIRM